MNPKVDKDSNRIVNPYSSNEMKYLALGDSYTIGEGVLASERWPMILQERLKEDHIQLAEPEFIATTGWTTFELKDAIDKQNIHGSYDLVSLLIGVNNQYRGLSVDMFRDEFEELLKIAIQFAGKDPKNVIVLSIPDYGVTPFASDRNPEKIRKELIAYNKVKKEVTEKAGVLFFDITPISLNAKFDKTLLAEDDLHPSGKMYSQWVDLIFEDVKSLLLKP